MASIFIGVPRSRIDPAFGASLFTFRKEIEKVHRVESHFVYGKGRDEARELLVDAFLDGDCEYLLFLDDDHTGHKPEMLQALIDSGAAVCALKCYARYFPFQCTLMTIDRVNRIYFADDTRRGYLKCNLVGFGMTLIRRDLFEVIDKPYFKCNKDGEREDNYFCEKLEKAGILPVGCFDYVLPHCGIDDSNIDEKRDEGLKILVKEQQKERVMKSIREFGEYEEHLNENEREALRIIRQNFKEEN